MDDMNFGMRMAYIATPVMQADGRNGYRFVEFMASDDQDRMRKFKRIREDVRASVAPFSKVAVSALA